MNHPPACHTPGPQSPAMATSPLHLSPSSASCFEQCPRRWRFKYVDRLPDPSGQAALVGGFAHRVLELLCQLPPARRTIDQAKALARTCWPEVEADPDYQALALDEAEARAFRWSSWLAVTGLWALEDPAAAQVVATEAAVRATLGQVPFVGIIDRVDRVGDDLVVSDYKSGTLPSARFQDDKVAQVLLYAAAWAEAEQRRPRRARLLYLGQRIIDIPVTDENLGQAVAALGATWASLDEACRRDRFEPRPGVLCGWCPFADRCPEGRAELTARRDQGRLPANAPALALVA